LRSRLGFAASKLKDVSCTAAVAFLGESWHIRLAVRWEARVSERAEIKSQFEARASVVATTASSFDREGLPLTDPSRERWCGQERLASGQLAGGRP
jgi:hypothetical protein